MRNFGTKLITLLALAALATSGCKKKDEEAAPKPVPGEPAAKAPGDKPAGDKPAEPTPPAGDKPVDPPAAAGDGLKFPAIPETVGTKFDVVDTMEMSMKVSAQGQNLDMVQTSSKKSTQEILAVEGDVVTKVKATFTELVETQGPAGKAKAKPSPAQGNTYVVEAKAGEVTVTKEGGTASPEETDEVKGEFKDLGRPDVMEKIIATKTFKIGEKVEFTPEDLKALAEDAVKSNTPPPTSASLTLTAMEGDIATFDLATVMASEEEGMKMEISIKGVVKVDTKKGHMLEMSMEGPVKGSGKATVEGVMKGKKTHTYK